jgi:hypothetical protein
VSGTVLYTNARRARGFDSGHAELCGSRAIGSAPALTTAPSPKGRKPRLAPTPAGALYAPIIPATGNAEPRPTAFSESLDAVVNHDGDHAHRDSNRRHPDQDKERLRSQRMGLYAGLPGPAEGGLPSANDYRFARQGR